MYGRVITSVKVSMYRCSEMNAQRASAAPEWIGEGMAERRGYRKTKHHITTQLQPVCGGAYGSSPFPTGPQTDGTYKSDEAPSGERCRHDAPDGLLSFCSSGSSCGVWVSRKRGKGGKDGTLHWPR